MVLSSENMRLLECNHVNNPLDASAFSSAEGSLLSAFGLLL
jgi:hypothetical protein